MTVAPILRTERLILREPVIDDWPGFGDMMMSERARYMGGPYKRAAAWGEFCHGIALWRLFGVGNLSIEAQASGAWLGQIEINQGPRYPEPELGWQLSAAAEGKGYAFEAAVALRDWAFEARGLGPLVSYIDPENARSIRLAERLGAALDETAPKQDPGDLVYRHRSGQAGQV